MDIEHIERTCIACPSQWEAKLKDGRMLYFRYRWGHLNITVSEEKTDDINDALHGELIFSSEVEESGWDGDMDDAKLVLLTHSILNYPESFVENAID